MNVILTDISKPFRRYRKPDGTLVLKELKIWPGWSYPKFKNLFSYQKDGVTHAIPVIMGKTYTFHDLGLLVNTYLNAKGQVALLYHNNGRVTFRVYPNVGIHNIKLDEGLAEMLGLKKLDKYEGVNTGEPVNESSIHFTYSNARLISLACRQIDNTYLNNDEAKVLCVMPVSVGSDGAVTANLLHPTIAAFHDNFCHDLTFQVQDERGNNLPINQLVIRLTINECV